MNKITTTIAALLLLSFNCQANSKIPEIQLLSFKHTKSVKKHPSIQSKTFNYQKPQNKWGHRQDQQNINNFDQQTTSDQHQDFKIAFNIKGGYRRDKLNWSIASPTGIPNILSELTWDNIEIAVFEAGISIQTKANWVLDTSFAYGSILDGKNQDSDYFGNDRTLEFSRTNNASDNGNTLDATLGFGYLIPIIPSEHELKPVLSFTPKIGASYHAQYLKILDGFQTIPALGHFEGLDSSYDTSWYGPWAGFDSEFSIFDCLSLFVSFEFHYAYYEATADLNLRTDLAHPKSFKHGAEGTGYKASIRSQFKLTQTLFLNLSLNYQKWRADKKGIDTLFVADGRSFETKLNEVEWESIGANIGLSYRF